jgi:hypothetical protein
VFRSLLCGLALLAIAASVAGAARVKTFDVNAPLTIALPATWHPVRADPGWRFKAVAPDFTAWTFLSARSDTVDFTSYAASFVAFEKQATSTLGTHVVFRTHAASVGGERAVLVYAAGRGTTTEYLYGFVHNGVDYVLAFAATAKGARAARPVFTAAVHSVQFKNP